MLADCWQLAVPPAHSLSEQIMVDFCCVNSADILMIRIYQTEVLIKHIYSVDERSHNVC